MPCLLISVRFHDGRYHGSGEWPPSPARLFQALVAGSARGQNLSAPAVEAFHWLETLDAPIIAVPSAHAGRGFKNFVPNNDLDAVDGDPARVAEIRAPKIVRPRMFLSSVPLVYAWTFESGVESERCAQALCEIANSLFQFGRGVDMAWAQDEIVEERQADARLREHGGILWRPNERGGGAMLSCPHRGSLASLTKRFAKTRERFKTVGDGKKARKLFTQALKPSFAQVPYNSPPTFHLFHIKHADAFAPQPLDRISMVTEKIRDFAAELLKRSTWRHDDPKREACIDQVFVGQNSTQADKVRRIRITPLPSIGHAQTERSIRRVLVTMPPDCPIPADDVAWTFSGLALDVDRETGEIRAELVRAGDRTMLTHYGIEDAALAHVWCTVTPAALSEHAARRRVDPHRMSKEAKSGAERLREEAAAQHAVRQALRHAGINTAVRAIRVQREPFEAKGQRAEAFAHPPRFLKERLWHVEITFAQPIPGPLVIGDGRYLGLGLMRPVSHAEGVYAFAVSDGLTDQADPLGVSRALRRAVMARVQAQIGEGATLPVFFSGHAPDGVPARSGRHRHLAFAFDAPRERLLIVAPHLLERREPSRKERENLQILEDALKDFDQLRAGASGVLSLVPNAIDLSGDPLFAPSTTWETVTAYRVTRHARMNNAAAVLEADLLTECRRAGLPRPQVKVDNIFAHPGRGLSGLVTMTFRSALAGPVLLGRDRHFGGGLFRAGF